MWFIPFEMKRKKNVWVFMQFSFSFVQFLHHWFELLFFSPHFALKIIVITEEMNIADFCVNNFILHCAVNVHSQYRHYQRLKLTEERLKCSICRCGRKITSQTLSSQFAKLPSSWKKKLYQRLLVPSVQSIIRLMRLSLVNYRHFYQHSNS